GFRPDAILGRVDPSVRGAVGGHVANVVDENRAPEGLEQPGEIRPHEPEPDDADDGSAELAPALLPPRARAEVGRALHDVAQETQHPAERELAHGAAVDPAGPPERDTALCERWLVDVVEAHAVLRDHADRPTSVEDRAVDPLTA